MADRRCSKNSAWPKRMAAALPETRLPGSGVQGSGQGLCAAMRSSSGAVNSGMFSLAMIAGVASSSVSRPRLVRRRLVNLYVMSQTHGFPAGINIEDQFPVSCHV